MSSLFTDLLNRETLDFFIDKLIKSSFDSLEKYFISLLSAMNINKVTEKEINNMDPAKIEELFNSFAAPYFTKLKLYGWMGSGIGGLVEILSLLK